MDRQSQWAGQFGLSLFCERKSKRAVAIAMSMDLSPLPDETRRMKIAQSLRRLITSGELMAGQRLTEQDLAERLGVSRAPVREAMRELVDSGLLVSAPYKGIWVRQFTERDLRELYTLRLELEKFAFRVCWNKRSNTALDDLKARNARLQAHPLDDGPDVTGIEYELHLHSWCFELSDHRLLQQAWQRLRPNLQLYFALLVRAQAVEVEHNPHDTYVRLACSDDLDAMLAHLDMHSQSGLNRTVSFLKESPGRAVSENPTRDGQLTGPDQNNAQD